MIFMTREQMREYDRVAMVHYGVAGTVLMENAGRGATEVVRSMLREHPGRTTIVCGKGNNGGDGFVIARHLLNAGHPVRLLLLGELAQLRGDARINAGILEAMDGEIVQLPGEDSPSRVASLLTHSSVIVDAIFGTGLERTVTGRYHGVIEAINEARARVMAVDLPSGLDANTGEALGIAVQAHRTATFACLKRGLVVHPGHDLAGEVKVVDIGAPRRIVDEVGFDGRLIGPDLLEAQAVARARDSHKGTYGHLLVVAGSPGKTGAALMAGMAALRSGTGLVTLAVPASVMTAVESAKPVEIMLEPLLSGADDPVTERELHRLAQIMEGKSALAFGPGCGVTEPMGRLLREVLDVCTVPLVLDADGLSLLARLPADTLAGRSAATVLTPHPGEMGRLLGTSASDVQKDRVGVSREYSRKTGAHVVLKGASTVVAAPDGSLYVNTTGNPGMATGGTGDVLTGILGGLLAQGLESLQASLLSVYQHGLAGDRAAESTGERALVAGDLLETLPEVWSEME